MTDFDDRLRRTLSEEDEAFLQELEDRRGLFDQLSATFQGPMRHFTWLANAVVLIATAIGLYCIWQMFQADTTRNLILWTAGGWAAWTIQIALKQWIWNRVNLLSTLRELKKIELRLARLEER